jgi:hypothetical protein
VNISDLKGRFEKMPNVKVLSIRPHGDFDAYASATILIDNKMLMQFNYFNKNSFKYNKGIVRVSRIADWDLQVRRYGYIGVREIGGGPVKSYAITPGLEFNKVKIFLKNNSLNDIKKIQDVISNYDSIFEVINKIPEYCNGIKNWEEYISKNMSEEQ